MSKNKLQPPRELLEKVMVVADVKGQLSPEERDELNDWGVYCYVKTLPGGSLLYEASGKITARLRFTVAKDGSITVEKYKLGDWERKLDLAYAEARFWMENLRVGEEIDGLLADAEDNEERIRRLEKRANEKSGDATSWMALSHYYIAAGRFKEAEKANINVIKAWSGVASLQGHLGQMYLIALRNAKHLKLSSDLAEYSGLTPQTLGYSYEQVRRLAELHLREAFRLVSPKDSELRTWLEKQLSALKLADKAAYLEEKPEAQLLIVLNNFQEYPDELAKHLEQMVEERPDFALAWSYLSTAYMATGRLKDAEKVAITAVELAPDGAICHFNLSTIYYMALCNSRGYDRDSIERFKRLIGTERVQQLRHIDPHIFPEEAPVWMPKVTLEALGCSYEYARQMVEAHAAETIRLQAEREFAEEAESQLATIRMMDEV